MSEPDVDQVIDRTLRDGFLVEGDEYNRMASALCAAEGRADRAESLLARLCEPMVRAAILRAIMDFDAAADRAFVRGSPMDKWWRDRADALRSLVVDAPPQEPAEERPADIFAADHRSSGSSSEA